MRILWDAAVAFVFQKRQYCQEVNKGTVAEAATGLPATVRSEHLNKTKRRVD